MGFCLFNNVAVGAEHARGVRDLREPHAGHRQLRRIELQVRRRERAPDEARRWDAQAVFWASIARVCAALKHPDIAWIDQDHLYVMSDFGPGSLTTSGYSRQVRTWTRGTPLTSAKVVFEGQETDVSVGGSRDLTEGFERDFVQRTPAFFKGELYLRTAGGKLQRVDVPDDAKAFLGPLTKEFLVFTDPKWQADKLKTGAFIAPCGPSLPLWQKAANLYPIDALRYE